MACPGQTGIQVISAGSAPVAADIVFVHGLQGDPVKTWSVESVPLDIRTRFQRLNPFRSQRRSQNSSDENPTTISGGTLGNHNTSTYWPKDLLAVDMKQVRVLTFGYSSNVMATFRSVSQNNIMQHAQNLVGDLGRERDGIDRPIIFVCHSLGGIIVKEALRQSSGATFQPRNQRLYEETYGVIFLGTPHRGSPWAPWAKLAANLAKLALQAPSTGNLQALQVDSVLLQLIADEFSKIIRSDKIKVYSFREEKGMSGLYGFDAKVVDDFSSIIGDAAEGQEGIDANHTQMCKFATFSDPGYKKVLGVIRDFVKYAGEGEHTADGRGFLRQELDKLPHRLRQKLELDRPFNNLKVSENPQRLTLDLPIFRGRVFEATTQELLTTSNRAYGSCGFELADLLKLVHGQSRSHLLETESMSLQEVVLDDETYYCRCSRDGLFQLLTQHFVSIRESSEQLTIQTDIGIFTLVTTDRRLLVRVNRNHRSSNVRAPESQDYSALKKCAAGMWCLREGDEQAFTTAGLLVHTPGTVKEWITPAEIIMLLAKTNIEHHNCIYFFNPNDYAELQFWKNFAREVTEALLWVYEKEKERLQCMAEAYDIFSVIGTRRIATKDNMMLYMASVRSLGACAVPPDDLADPHSTSTNKPTTERDHLPDVTAESLNESSLNHPDAMSNRTSLFHLQCEKLQDELAASFRDTKSRNALQSQLLAVLDKDPHLVAGQFGINFLILGNAEWILRQAISAPAGWLELLTADGEVYVG